MTIEILTMKNQSKSYLTQKKWGMQENVLLAPYTTFRIGGPARYFFVAETIEDLKEAAEFAQNKNLPIFILGGGSNILVSDEGFAGVVVLISLKGIEIKDAGKNYEVGAAAGEVWDELIELLVSKNISGLENMTAVPGKVGAAPMQNIGCYGSEVSEFISAVQCFNTKTLKDEIFTKEECGFGYRNSIFKQPEKSHLIVTRVSFSLPEHFSPNISYKDLAEYFSKTKKEPTLKNIREALVEIRGNKLPDTKKTGTAGSFFKNPVVSSGKAQELARQFFELPRWQTPDGREKVLAAFLIDKVCELKGIREGGAQVWDKQALVLVNDKEATARDILSLAEKITNCVREKTGIELEREVQLVQ